MPTKSAVALFALDNADASRYVSVAVEGTTWTLEQSDTASSVARTDALSRSPSNQNWVRLELDILFPPSGSATAGQVGVFLDDGNRVALKDLVASTLRPLEMRICVGVVGTLGYVNDDDQVFVDNVTFSTVP
jgi:hypothetical protein